MVPLLDRHGGDVHGGGGLVVLNYTEEVLVVIGSKAWVRQTVLLKNMVSEQQLMEQAVRELGVD